MTTRGHTGILAAILVAATLFAYQPAWNGGILWDDDGHLTRPELRTTEGFARIWLEPGATQQYYPVVHSAFWLFHRLWGDSTAPYHLVNIGLHALSAVLLALILRRLSVPGAWLAAAVFALHPVHVESVAWITELKNVLSGVFYLAAAVVYLRFDQSRSRSDYVTALVLFVLAALSKSVTVTLPVALLITFWWQRGRVRLREDLRPLIPFFAFGLLAGLTTVWVERTFIGAQGAEFVLTFVQRILLAARAIVFYLGKLVWPADLVFIYPRWTIDPASAVSWMYLLAVIAALACAWTVRHRTRAPLAALLFFCVTLFPALGFFDVYPFRFSYVADHFQYLASIGPIALLASGLSVAAGKARALPVLACTLAVLLGSLTFAQARHYTNGEALYRTTIDRNPSAWLARNNLAALLLAGDPSQERIRDAVMHLEEAIRLKPGYAEAHYNLGTAFERQRRWDEAMAQYEAVLRVQLNERRTLERLAIMRHDRASARLEEGLVHESGGRLADAERAYREAAALDPQRAIIRRSLGRTLQRLGRREDAIAEYRASLELDPSSAETHNDLGVLLAELGRMREALAHFERAVNLSPDDPAARANLVRARAALPPR